MNLLPSTPRRALLVACMVSGLFTGALCANDLQKKLKPLIDAHKGDVAVAVKHLDSGESFAYRADQPMPTASLIKFPVMIEAYRQAAAELIDLDSLISIEAGDKVPGSGILTEHFSAGSKIRLRDVIRLMIAYSDNTATNLVLDQIGIAATAKQMEVLGLPNTKLHSKVFRRTSSLFPARSERFGLGSTTATETLRLYELLHQKKLISKSASDEMLEHLLHCEDESKLMRFLPDETKVAHKGGAVSRVRCDAGIVFAPTGPFALCVLTSNNEDRSWTRNNAGNRFCAEVTRVVYRHFAGGATTPGNQATTLEVGDSGRLVEDLQRTLNVRLNPSPVLAVDGDFGPITRAAVSRFQKENKLPASGRVDPQTWHALGTLVTTDPPIPEPATINDQQLPRAPRDSLDGRPFVTCKAWAIADGRTGEMLWSHNSAEQLDFASTTKIMTAFVVLRLCEKEPQVLDEEIVFSSRADRTGGSTSGVRAGERLAVRELLYGLLLPSGNDASVALAEHFGNRLAPSETAAKLDPLPLFVDAMNRTAAELGMHSTHYCNPHGLTESEHLSTAVDLLRLAHAAWQLDSFRNYVGTRQRGCQLVGAGEYRRNIVWKNTNRLLAIEGFRGIKTGTTSAAGACLVSSAIRGDDHLLMVVLGAQSSGARYVDSRNLIRWAWRQRLAVD